MSADGLDTVLGRASSNEACGHARALCNVRQVCRHSSYYSTTVLTSSFNRNNQSERDIVKLRALQHLVPADRQDKEWPPRISQINNQHPLVKVTTQAVSDQPVDDGSEEIDDGSDVHGRHCLLFLQREYTSVATVHSGITVTVLTLRLGLFPTSLEEADRRKALETLRGESIKMVAWKLWIDVLLEYGFVIVNWPEGSRAPSTTVRYAQLKPVERQSIGNAFRSTQPPHFRKRLPDDGESRYQGSSKSETS